MRNYIEHMDNENLKEFPLNVSLDDLHKIGGYLELCNRIDHNDKGHLHELTQNAS